MANFLRATFSASNGAANIIRVIALIAALVLFGVARHTLKLYQEDQRVLNLLQQNQPAEEEAAPIPVEPVPSPVSPTVSDGQSTAPPATVTAPGAPPTLFANLAEETEIETEDFTPAWLVGFHLGAGIACALGLVFSLALGHTRWGLVTALSLVCIGIVAAWMPWDLRHNIDSLDVSKVGEDPSPWAYFVEIGLIGLLILSPPIALGMYYRSALLDRYVMRSVFSPLAMSFFGFIAIWVIMDMTDNGGSFIRSGAGFALLGFYYLVQLPQMVLIVLPITLLLSVLYALGKMSKSNEMISMLGAGMSMGRVLRPVFLTGAYCSLICVVLKYEWAPQAEAHKEGILNQLNDAAQDKTKAKGLHEREEYAALGWMYRNSVYNRTWFVGRVPVDLAKNPMRFVCIYVQGPDGSIISSYRADSVSWEYRSRVWVLRKVKIQEFDEFGFEKKKYFPIHEIPGVLWPETPWHVVSSSYQSEYLGIPGLTTYLRTNHQLPPKKLAPYRTRWHYSWAEPLRCFFIVLMAAPLGIVHSRRGILGGVAASLIIFFALIFFDSFFLALGNSGRTPAWVGAWTPDILLALVGGILFWARSQNKELPKLSTLFRRA